MRVVGCDDIRNCPETFSLSSANFNSILIHIQISINIVINQILQPINFTNSEIRSTFTFLVPFHASAPSITSHDAILTTRASGQDTNVYIRCTCHIDMNDIPLPEDPY